MMDSDKKWAIACYVPVFNLVVCILTSIKKVDSKFCLLHARQGLILFSLWFITIFAVLVSPFLALVLWIVVIFLHIYGIFTALSGAEMKIPVVSQFAMKIPEYYIFELLTGRKPEQENLVKPDDSQNVNNVQQ